MCRDTIVLKLGPGGPLILGQVLGNVQVGLVRNKVPLGQVRAKPKWTTDLPLVETSGHEVEDQEGTYGPSQPYQSTPTSPQG